MGPKEYPESTPPPSGKISEPSGTYTATPSAKSWKPAATMHRIGGLEASDEVWQFAREHQLIPPLETSIRLARETFKGLRSIRLKFEPDPEIPSLDGIGIRVRAKGSLEDLVQQDRAFQDRFLKEIPREHHSKICLFLGGV